MPSLVKEQEAKKALLLLLSSATFLSFLCYIGLGPKRLDSRECARPVFIVDKDLDMETESVSGQLSYPVVSH